MHVEFPFRVRSGTVDLADDDEWVVGLIEQVLFTIPGERVNLPTFGCGVQQLVFQQNSSLVVQQNSSQLAAAVQYMIKSELQRWLATIADIKSVVATSNQEVLAITIDYVNLITGKAGQVTLPRSP